MKHNLKTKLKQWIPRSARVRLREGERAAFHWAARQEAALLGHLPDAREDLETALYEFTPLTPEAVILGYAQGMFLAPEFNGTVRWHNPDVRGVVPLDAVHIPKSLRGALNKRKFEIRCDSDFAGVLDGCAEPAPGRETTFITPELRQVTLALHAMGVAHCVEAYQDGALVGGSYGLALNGYFSGNSMFHRVNDAGKVAFLYQVELLRRNGFTLLDVWWLAPALEKFGEITIPRAEFRAWLARALSTPTPYVIPDDLYVDHRRYA